MTNAEIKSLLEQQLHLLAESSRNETGDLPRLTEQMLKVSDFLIRFDQQYARYEIHGELARDKACLDKTRDAP